MWVSGPAKPLIIARFDRSFPLHLHLYFHCSPSSSFFSPLFVILLFSSSFSPVSICLVIFKVMLKYYHLGGKVYSEEPWFFFSSTLAIVLNAVLHLGPCVLFFIHLLSSSGNVRLQLICLMYSRLSKSSLANFNCFVICLGGNSCIACALLKKTPWFLSFWTKVVSRAFVSWCEEEEKLPYSLIQGWSCDLQGCSVCYDEVPNELQDLIECINIWLLYIFKVKTHSKNS